MRFWKKYASKMQSGNRQSEKPLAEKPTMLCIGLDTVFENLPIHLQSRSIAEGITEFNKRIIEATHDIAAAYKINLAFYEQYGLDGWRAFEATLQAIPNTCITIADAKRGDIGNTSKAYAKAFFERYDCDAITVAPYMGQDSVTPFLEYSERMTFVLALTSNAGSHDFQRLQTGNKPLYKTVVQTSLAWASAAQGEMQDEIQNEVQDMTGKSNCGFVVGATHPQELADLRAMIPGAMLLIPGIGAQGGDLKATVKANAGGPALINVSRGIIYASQNADFAEVARTAAMRFNADVQAVLV